MYTCLEPRPGPSTPLMGPSSKEQSAESHPHRSNRTRELQSVLVAISLYLRQKASFALLKEDKKIELSTRGTNSINSSFTEGIICGPN